MSDYRVKTAAQSGLWLCHGCGLLCRAGEGAQSCPRCHAALHSRKPHSLQRSWALLLAAMVAYLPANLLPIMETSTIMGMQNDTIMSGVVYLWKSGSWPLALVVFTASVLVPLLKILALLLLLVTVQLGSGWAPRQRTRLYRVVEVIGPWSMLDIYVVALMVALVQWQSLASIKAGPGAIAFGTVVVLTMVAAMSFDPRLIWDQVKEDDEQ
ncbi:MULTISPECIES: paraquat-inducible protein A [Chromobacterium]|uniref:paraquat-inducible protein A n=1 Tax=Chromobacterium TaxID=535 RepID=UPI000D31E8A9|nr:MULTISPECIES: paraquat-inducible protein A [Chromobacterium]PTU64646.1 paraquat-inducible membrane protein A [Chromobacterium sp. Panama]UJB30515.1 paraquat-inducible membrane protein A [Chromobacterium sp. Beijing]